MNGNAMRKWAAVSAVALIAACLASAQGLSNISGVSSGGPAPNHGSLCQNQAGETACPTLHSQAIEPIEVAQVVSPQAASAPGAPAPNPKTPNSNTPNPNTPQPSAPGPNPSVNPNKLDTEVVVILDNLAYPDTITRKPGPFYLLLVNRARGAQPKLIFDSPTAAAAQIPVLGQALKLPRLAGAQKLTSIFNPPPGKYLFKSQTSGRVLLTINIGE